MPMGPLGEPIAPPGLVAVSIGKLPPSGLPLESKP